MTSDRFPGPYAQPMFPAGVGVRHGSGVTTPSGAFLYVYSDGAHEIRESVFPGWIKFLHDKTVNTDFEGTWFTGKPTVDRVAVGDRFGDELWNPACTIFWADGTLWMTTIYKVSAPGATPGLGTGGDPVANYSDLWVSPSGEGGDWTHHSIIQTGPPGWGAGSPPAEDLVAGEPLDVGGSWVLSCSEWYSVGDARAAVFHGSPGSWTRVHYEDFGFGGSYGNGASRMVGESGGTLLWSCWSDSLDGPLGTRFVAATSGDGGWSWSAYADPVVSDGAGDLYHRHCQLGSKAGVSFRTDGAKLQRSSSVTTSWEPMWDLRFDRGVQVTASLWREVAPGAWLLFSHDKVWAMFGGWLVGAIGHS